MTFENKKFRYFRENSESILDNLWKAYEFVPTRKGFQEIDLKGTVQNAIK